MKTKNHMIINRCRKGSDKIQAPFMIKTLQKVSTDGPYLNIIKTVYVKYTANIILNRETLKAFPLTTWIRQECSLLPLLLYTFLEVLATTIRKEQEIKGIQVKKKKKKKLNCHYDATHRKSPRCHQMTTRPHQWTE